MAAIFWALRLAHEDSASLEGDNHLVFGGEAKRNQFMVDGQRIDGTARRRSLSGAAAGTVSWRLVLLRSLASTGASSSPQKWNLASHEIPVGDSFEDQRGAGRIFTLAPSLGQGSQACGWWRERGEPPRGTNPRRRCAW